ncbi:DUF1311 domain-containing protein [Paenibacillus sp. CGMCC 1.16610]|uniref:DUF1311 domain-containing protein n=1 Tax=Paenibacillus anseongense TaxID=2682845 RepID=A0ABW9UEY9_9BACL|nr:MULTISPECIES: lysozyme inhibitor LprI family protein [Paenibacillus]MBA2943874.1 DUF1311 domain-containing protein [Paenibacillus sp. CGMCC 1.16610]MVQ37763.1 DUF1311 domain-containing protein [Paenibacillus anseongense]
MNRLIVSSFLLVILTSCSDTPAKDIVDSAPIKSAGTESTVLIDKSTNSKSIDVESESIDTKVYSDYLSNQPERQFSKVIRDNPIDKDYAKENNEFQNSTDFNTSNWVELEAKYTRIWDQELNNIYEKLLTKLNAEDKESLIKAQRGWVQYQTNEIEFSEHFINLSDEKGPLLGTQGYVDTQIATKNRIKTRTIQLYEYYYLIDEKIEFTYKSKV